MLRWRLCTNLLKCNHAARDLFDALGIFSIGSNRRPEFQSRSIRNTGCGPGTMVRRCRSTCLQATWCRANASEEAKPWRARRRLLHPQVSEGGRAYSVRAPRDGVHYSAGKRGQWLFISKVFNVGPYLAINPQHSPTRLPLYSIVSSSDQRIYPGTCSRHGSKQGFQIDSRCGGTK